MCSLQVFTLSDLWQAQRCVMCCEITGGQTAEKVVDINRMVVVESDKLLRCKIKAWKMGAIE